MQVEGRFLIGNEVLCVIDVCCGLMGKYCFLIKIKIKSVFVKPRSLDLPVKYMLEASNNMGRQCLMCGFIGGLHVTGE